MSSFYHNPEYVISRANEFIHLGKHTEAIDYLFDFIKNKRSRILKDVHENVMTKLLKICVEQKITQIARDAIYLYKIICYDVNMKSWEDIVIEFLNYVDQKVEIAKETSMSVQVDANINYNHLTSLLESVCTEDGHDRIGRSIFLPWVKFSWECYRFCLDILRNAQGEKLYHTVISKACKLCTCYSLKNEFRKLCNVLYIHFNYFQKRHIQVFSKREIQIMYVETGLVVLESAMQLKSWQDAFRTVENIHMVLNILKKNPDFRITDLYYKKLSHMLWEGNELLFHAAATLRHFLLLRDMKKGVSDKEISMFSCNVVLAVLSVPFPARRPEMNLMTENDESYFERKQQLLATLSEYPCRANRQMLVKDIENYGILQTTPTEVVNVFHLLEYKMDHLILRNYLKQMCKFIQDLENEYNLKKYILPVYKISIIRLISYFSKIYTSFSLSKLASFSPPIDDYSLEIIIINAIRIYSLPIKIDHANKCIYFKNQFLLDSNKINNGKSECYIEQMYTVLTKVANQLQKEYCPPSNKLNRKKIIEDYWESEKNTRLQIKKRKKTIEKWKEIIERLKIKKEEEERKRAIEIQLKYEEAEKKRLAKETEERNIQRRLREQDQIKKQILQGKIEILKNSEIGPYIEKLNITDVESMGLETLLCKYIEVINKEKKVLISRLKRQERSADHMERAKRIEEIPLLVLKCDQDKENSKLQWEEDEKSRILKANENRVKLVKTKARMLVMHKDLMDFISKVKEAKRYQYEQEMIAFNKLLQEEREKRLKKRAEERKAQRRLNWLKEQQLKFKEEKETKNAKTLHSNDSFVAQNKLCENKSETVPDIDKINNRYQNSHFSRKDDFKLFGNKRNYDRRELNSSSNVFKRSRNSEDSSVHTPERNHASLKNSDYESQSQESSIFNQDSKDSFSYKLWQRQKTTVKKSELCSSNSKYTNSKNNFQGNRSNCETASPKRWREYSKEDSFCKMKDRRQGQSDIVDFVSPCQKVLPPSSVDQKFAHDSKIEAQNENISNKKELHNYRPTHSCTPWAKLKRENRT